MRTISAEIPAWITNDWTTVNDLVSHEDQASAVGSLSYYPQKIEGWTKVGTAQITVTFDDDDEIIGNMVDALKAQKQKVQADAQVEINRIEERIQSLLALPNHSEVEV